MAAPSETSAPDGASKPKKDEIERKFLVVDDSWSAGVTRAIPMLAGYLHTDPRCVVRVRIEDDRAELTLKGESNASGRKRPEFPFPISSVQEARDIIELLSIGVVIDKTRYLVPQGDATWEIDVFHGALAGLITAEIELDHEDDPLPEPLPSWLGREVTTDFAYSNAALAAGSAPPESALGRRARALYESERRVKGWPDFDGATDFMQREFVNLAREALADGPAEPVLALAP